MSTFDPNTFLSATYDEANDTKTIPVPAGEYLALAEKVDVKAWSTKDGSKSGVKLEIVWDIQNEEVKSLLGRDKVTSRQQIMLDTTEAGGLDFSKGKNVALGRLREATGTNVAGEPFGFPMLQGRMATVVVSHRIDGEDIYDEIKKVAKAS